MSVPTSGSSAGSCAGWATRGRSSRSSPSSPYEGVPRPPSRKARAVTKPRWARAVTTPSRRRRVGVSWPTPQLELLLRAALSEGDEAVEAWRRWSRATELVRDGARPGIPARDVRGSGSGPDSSRVGSDAAPARRTSGLSQRHGAPEPSPRAADTLGTSPASLDPGARRRRLRELRRIPPAALGARPPLSAARSRASPAGTGAVAPASVTKRGWVSRFTSDHGPVYDRLHDPSRARHRRSDRRPYAGVRRLCARRAALSRRLPY